MEDDIKMDVIELLGWVYMAEDIDRWRATVKRWVLKTAGIAS